MQHKNDQFPGTNKESSSEGRLPKILLTESGETLYLKGTRDCEDIDSINEVVVTRILDVLDIPHINYRYATNNEVAILKEDQKIHNSWYNNHNICVSTFYNPEFTSTQTSLSKILTLSKVK